MAQFIGDDSNNDIIGTPQADVIWGFGGDDTLRGRDGNDSLYGGSGDDLLFGGSGRDVLTGGDGTFFGGKGNDTLTWTGTAGLGLGGSGNDAFSSGGGRMRGGSGDDRLAMTGTGGTIAGSSGADRITFTQTGSTIDGLSLRGGSGSDHFIVNLSSGLTLTDRGDVEIRGGAGIDRLDIRMDLSDPQNDLKSLHNVLTRIHGVEVIHFEFDRPDSYIPFVSLAALDLRGVGMLTVSGSAAFVGTYVKDTRLNIIAGVIPYSFDFYGYILDVQGAYAIGGDADDILRVASLGFDTYIYLAGGAGDDVIISGRGISKLYGDAGDDRIIGRSGLDTIYGGDGADMLYGGAARDNLFGGGGKDTLYGGAGNDSLDGGGPERDVLYGGYGDDIYWQPTGDKIIEAADGGYDTVYTNVSMTLPDHVEAIQISNTSAVLTLTGNGQANRLTGNDFGTIFDGKGGNDIIDGKGGADTFVFTTLPGSGNVDTIIGFQTRIDVIHLDSVVYKALPKGALAQGAFTANADGQARDANDRIILETDTGMLYYDPDGTGASGRRPFATIGPETKISASDFFIF